MAAVEAIRAQGRHAAPAMVTVGAEDLGYEVRCYGCGLTARMPHPLPEGKAVLCPDCCKSV